MKKVIQTENAPKAIGPYSQAIEVDGTLYCSGQVPIDAKSGEIFLGSIEGQTEKVMENIKAVLEASGYSLKNVVKTTIFITNMNDFAKVNEVYARYFAEAPPARSTVAVAALPKGAHVEIEVLARKS